MSSSVSTALKRLGAKRMGWWLDKEFVIATNEGTRKADMTRAEDRAAIRDFYRHVEQQMVRFPSKRRARMRRRAR